ncbi:hypothetical protein A3Q56_06363 [Intoshia linei]|uniref:RGS domain-containing protein n=1 Tax=Intoshia linei TaxID=1819745 RepID=A0A177AVA4_9BILA|nr:hypothetical protein A3Q56_06363 [Intoshia linei]
MSSTDSWRTVDISVEPDSINSVNFEEYIGSDPLFVDFLNRYLASPVFPEKIQFNRKNSCFQYTNSSESKINKAIKKVYHDVKNAKPVPFFHPVRNHSYTVPKSINFNIKQIVNPLKLHTTYNVEVLSKDQCLSWIKENRLEHFLVSRHYSEFRISSLIAQIFKEYKDIYRSNGANDNSVYFKPMVDEYQKFNEFSETKTEISQTEDFVSCKQSSYMMSTSETYDDVSLINGHTHSKKALPI